MRKLLYGQAEYYYSLSCEMTEKLEERGLITADQRKRIDELDRRSIYEMYPSVNDMDNDNVCKDNDKSNVAS